MMAPTDTISGLWGRLADYFTRCRHAWERFWFPLRW
jgi:hypothetical protein